MKNPIIFFAALLLGGCAIVNTNDGKYRPPYHPSGLSAHPNRDSLSTKERQLESDRIVASVEKLAKEILAERAIERQDEQQSTKTPEPRAEGKSPVMPVPPPLVTVPDICKSRARNYVPLPTPVDSASLERALSMGDSKTVITVLIKNIDELNAQLRRAKVLESTRNKEIVRSCPP